MFEGYIPRLKIGCLMPGSAIDNHAFEFYRLAPPGVMLVMVGVGLREFSRHDVERVFVPLDRYLHQLMERGVDLVIQNGVPLPILIGIEAHDIGGATQSLHPADFHRFVAGDHMQLAYDLGRRAFLDHPDCDAIYIGGGSWIAEPVAVRLEAEFAKPVLCNQAAVIRNTLKMLGGWTPLAGHSRVLATP